MIRTTRHTIRWATLTLLCTILAAGVLFPGCGPAPQDQKTSEKEAGTPSPTVKVTATKIPEKQPAPAAPAAAPDKHPDKADAPQSASAETAVPTVDKQAAQENLIKCFKDIRYLWSRDPKPSAEDVASWEKKWELLLSKNGAPSPMCDEADLVSTSFQRPAKEGEPTFIYMLFRVNKPFVKDRGMHVKGYVDLSHRQHLPQDHRNDGYAEWGYLPEPPTTQWKANSVSIAGESYILIRRGVLAAEIPYDIKIGFFMNEEGGARFTGYGKAIDLGWRVAN